LLQTVLIDCEDILLYVIEMLLCIIHYFTYSERNVAFFIILLWGKKIHSLRGSGRRGCKRRQQGKGWITWSTWMIVALCYALRQKNLQIQRHCVLCSKTLICDPHVFRLHALLPFYFVSAQPDMVINISYKTKIALFLPRILKTIFSFMIVIIIW